MTGPDGWGRAIMLGQDSPDDDLVELDIEDER